jgi:dTDP-4-dehydrorhamnose reductase
MELSRPPRSPSCGRMLIVNCAAWTDVDGAEADEAAALRVNGVAPGHLARAATEQGAQLIHVSTDYVFDGTAQRPYVESDRRDRAAPTAGPSWPGSRPSSQPAAGTRSCARPGCSVPPGELRRDDARSRRRSRRRDGRRDQIGSPTFTGHLAAALIDIAERRVGGIAHVAGAGQCSWSELAAQIFEQAGVAAPCSPVTSSEFPRPAPRPAWSVLASERDDVPRCRRGSEGLAPISPRSARGSRDEAARLRRRRLHRLELRATAAGEQRRRDRRARQAHLRRSAREPARRRVRPRFTFVHGAIEDPEAVEQALAGAAAVVNFAAETHVDRSIAEPDAFVRTHALGTYVLLEAARERGLRYLQVSTDEVYGSIEQGSFTRARRSSPPRPTARRRPAPTCSSPPTSAPSASRR